jgi:hypothetical protein
MKRTIVVTGAIVATVIGSGSAALAVSSLGWSSSPGVDLAASATTAPATAPSAPATTQAKGSRGDVLAKLSHIVQGRVVTRGKDGSFVTHDVIIGKVAQVSPSSITVRAADGANEVYAVNAGTTVVIRADGKGVKGAIGDVHVGDGVVVTGTGATGMTAKRIVDRQPPVTTPSASQTS